MTRTVAVVWHASFSFAAGVLYFLFVLPRWWELSGDTSHRIEELPRTRTPWTIVFGGITSSTNAKSYSAP